MSWSADLSDHTVDFDPGEPPERDGPPLESYEDWDAAQSDWACDVENVVSSDVAREHHASNKVEPQEKVGLGWSRWPILDGKSPVPILANVMAALEHAPALQGLIGPGPMLLRRPPWERGPASWTPREFTSADTISLTELFQRSGLLVYPSHIRDALQSFGASTSGGDLDTFVSAADLLRQPMKPRPWLVEAMIPAGQPTEIRGDGGLGKSTLALQLAVAVASGGQWLGEPTSRGPAVYLAGEDDVEEIHRRLAAIATHEGLEFEKLADLHVWPLAAENPALVEGDERGKLTPTRRWHELAQKVGEVGAALVILDSRADVFGGSEINRAQVRQFVGMQRELALATGAAVVMLAHPSLTGMASRSGNSGSTHWGNAVRSALYLCRPESGGHPDPDARELSIVKANYGAAGGKLALRWTIGGFVVEEGPSAGIRPQSRKDAEAEADRTFLALLDKFIRRGIRVSASAGPSYAPKAFAGEPEAGGRTPKVLAAAMSRLLDHRQIVVATDGPPSKRRSFLTFPDVGSE